jgi:peptidoglycan/LPS O-acetylase OafA/YrhL
MTATRPTDFSPALHGIRGLAVLLVVFSHLGNAGFSLPLLPHNSIGKAGVWMFFVLSAYLLTSRLYEDTRRHRPSVDMILAYFTQRVFRIYPLLVFVLAMHVLFSGFGKATVIEHLLMIDGRAELWAIPVEFKYYLVIPIIVLATHVARFGVVMNLLVLAVMAATAYSVFTPFDASDLLSLVPRATPFLIGSMAGLLFGRMIRISCQHPPRFSWLQFMPLVLLLACTAFFRFASLEWRSPVGVMLSPWVDLIMSLTVAAIIYSTFRWQAMRALFSSSLLVFLGKISFSLYLLHMFVIGFMIDVNIPIRTSLKPWICLVAAIAIAAVTYRLIERPGLRLGSLLSRHLRAPADPASQQKNTPQSVNPAG